MRPISEIEFQKIVAQLEPLVGSRLQEVVLHLTGDIVTVALGFYLRGDLFYLGTVFDTKTPFIWYELREDPIRKKSEKKPVGLFVSAHIKGRILNKVRVPAEMGRILILDFGRDEDENPYEIEIQLIPHHPNLLARAGGKSISLDKPLPVKPQAAPAETEVPRAWVDIMAEYKGTPAPPVKGTDPLQKKISTREKMQIDLNKKKTTPWRELGDWLKTHAHRIESLRRLPPDFPDAWQPLINPKLATFEQIEICFEKARLAQRKLAEAEKRLKHLDVEIERLEAGEVDAPQVKSGKSLLSTSQSQGRSFKIAEDLICYVGKSAKDNLNLLRKAAPTDFWLHLKDYPGAYGILRRSRSRLVSDAELHSAACWVAEQSLKKNAKELSGERLQMLVAECRFVRPLKGDRLGRATFQNERVLVLKY